MSLNLGPRPTRKALERNAHKNYIIRMKVLKYILELFATQNGMDYNNFGVLFKDFPRCAGEPDIRQFYICTKGADNTVVVDTAYPQVYPQGIIWHMMLSYCYDKYDNAVGMIRVNSKVYPLVEKGEDNIVIVPWVGDE